MLILKIPRRCCYWYQLNKLPTFGQIIIVKEEGCHDGANLARYCILDDHCSHSGLYQNHMIEVTSVIHSRTKGLREENH